MRSLHWKCSLSLFILGMLIFSDHSPKNRHENVFKQTDNHLSQRFAFFTVLYLYLNRFSPTIFNQIFAILILFVPSSLVQCPEKFEMFQSTVIFSKIFPSQTINNDLDISLIRMILKLTKKTLNNSEEVKAYLIFEVWSTAFKSIQVMSDFVLIRSQGTWEPHNEIVTMRFGDEL